MNPTHRTGVTMNPKYRLARLREPGCLVVCLCLAAYFHLDQAHAQLASPLATPATGAIVPGEVVFADLVTTDVERAARFYSAVFGWTLRPGEDPGYVELVHAGELVGAIVAFENDVDPGSARWLPSVSVPDVDIAVESVLAMGGTILEPPVDFPDRGRLAVISDLEGAVLMLLTSTSGDPERTVGGFGWAELWARDVVEAVRFYEGALGYRAFRSAARGAPATVVLTTGGSARATIVAAPGKDIEPNWIPYVEVADAREILETVRSHSGTVLLTSDEVDGDVGTFAAIIADPTGGVFAIQNRGASR
jgi:predicted enzyme related to lactoylglutathione lyase